ncbi:hypothetical protein ACVIW0_002869 [Bradyrhizobium sp. USDA 4454]
MSQGRPERDWMNGLIPMSEAYITHHVLFAAIPRC